MTEEELRCLEAAQARVAAVFGMEVPPPPSFNPPGELYTLSWKEICENLDPLGDVDPTCTRPLPSLLRNLCLAVLKSRFRQSSLLVVFAEALFRLLLVFPGKTTLAELEMNFRPDMKEIIGGLAQALVEQRGMLPSQAHKKIKEHIGINISEGAIRKHHERFIKDYNYPIVNSNGQNHSSGAPFMTKAPLWFWA
jgi:hypothetical protein